MESVEQGESVDEFRQVMGGGGGPDLERSQIMVLKTSSQNQPRSAESELLGVGSTTFI